jgi:hypothetical protein
VPDLFLNGRDIAAQFMAFPVVIFNLNEGDDMRARLPHPLMTLANERHDLVPFAFNTGAGGSQLIRESGGIDELERLGELPAHMGIMTNRYDTKFH